MTHGLPRVVPHGSALPLRQRSVLLIGGVVLVLVGGCSTPRTSDHPVALSQAAAVNHPLKWPLTLQYEYTVLDDRRQPVLIERHEFSGRSWTEWTDVRLSVQALNAEGRGISTEPPGQETGSIDLNHEGVGELHVQRYAPDGQHTDGYVRDLTPLAPDGFLEPSIYSASLSTPVTTTIAAGEPSAPSYLFNPAFGRVPPDSVSVVVTVPPDELARRTEVAGLLGVAPQELLAIAVKLWDCGEVPQADCQDLPSAQQREVVLHPESGIPLQASATGPDFDQGTEIITVTALRANPTFYT